MRRLALARLIAPMLVVACADDATRPASWPTRAGAQRASFPTTASVAQVRANACALVGTFDDGQRSRNWSVTVGDRPCWSQPNASSIPLLVYMKYKGDDGTVVLEAAASDVPQQTLREAVTSTSASLEDAIKRTQEARATGAQKNGHGGAIAAAAVGGGLTVAAVVVVVVVVVGAVIAGFAALFSAFGKAFH